MLPNGLTEGEIVKLLEFDHGTYTVECPNGRKYRINSTCIVPVPREFYANHRAETFFKRVRALFRTETHRSGLFISTGLKYLRFSVFGDDEKPRGSLEIHKEAILNLGSEFRERICRQLLAIRARPYR